MGKYRRTQVKQKLKRKNHRKQKKPRESISNTRNTDANIFGLLQEFERAVEQLSKVRKRKQNKLSENQSASDEFESPVQSPLRRNQSRKSGKRPARKRTARNSRAQSEFVDSVKCHRCRLLRQMDVVQPAPESVEPRLAPSSTESVNGAPASVSVSGKRTSTGDGSIEALPISSARNASNTSKPDQVVTECDDGLMLSEFHITIPDPQQYQNNFLKALNSFYHMCQQVDEHCGPTLYPAGDATPVQSSSILGEQSTDDTHRNGWSQDEDEDYND